LQHRGIEFAVQQARGQESDALRFRWIIYQAVEQGEEIVGTELYPTWEDAEKACRIEIESGRQAGSIVAVRTRPQPSG